MDLTILGGIAEGVSSNADAVGCCINYCDKINANGIAEISPSIRQSMTEFQKSETPSKLGLFM